MEPEQWGSKKEIRERYGVPACVLQRWTSQGKVRCVKLGEMKQARTLYAGIDVQKVLLSLSTNSKSGGAK